MSGGVMEEYKLESIAASSNNLRSKSIDLENFWAILTNARKKSAVIGATINHFSITNKETIMPNGLVRGHAYIISKMAEIGLSGKVEKIVKLYNPWGNNTEWKGEWSDR